MKLPKSTAFYVAVAVTLHLILAAVVVAIAYFVVRGA